MTVSIQDAATKAINLGKQLKAVIDVGECLQELGSLEQAIAEAKRHSVEAKARCAEDQLKQQEVSAAVKDARELLEQAKAEVIGTQQDAEAFYHAKVREANAEAAQIRKMAAADSSSMILKAELKVEVAERVSDDLLEKIVKQQIRLDGLLGQEKALKERLG